MMNTIVQYSLFRTGNSLVVKLQYKPLSYHFSTHLHPPQSYSSEGITSLIHLFTAEIWYNITFLICVKKLYTQDIKFTSGLNSQ